MRTEWSDFKNVVDSLFLGFLQLLHESPDLAILCHLVAVSARDIFQLGISSKTNECINASPVSLLCSYVQGSGKVEICAVNVRSSLAQDDQRPVDMVCAGTELGVGADYHPVHWTEAALQVDSVDVGSSRDERLHDFVSCVHGCVVQNRHLIIIGRVYIDSSIGQCLNCVHVSSLCSLEELFLIGCHLELSLHFDRLSPGGAPASQQVAPSLDGALSSQAGGAGLVAAYRVGASWSRGRSHRFSLLLGTRLLASKEVCVTHWTVEFVGYGQKAVTAMSLGRRGCVAIAHF